MADATFAQIEAALVARLEDQLDYLVQCASYAGQVEDANNGLPLEAPACFVSFDGWERDDEASDNRQHVGEGAFSVIVVADSYVGGTQSRTGSQGAYEIVDAVITALDDYAAVTGFPGLTVRGVEMVRVDKLRAIYRVRFTGTVVVSR